MIKSSFPKNSRPFVDREEYVQAFREHLEKMGNKPSSILAYYGIGGIGKTSLLKELQNVLEEYKESHQNCSIAWVSADFGIESYRHTYNFLTFLKKDLQEKYDVKFHLFEIAHAIYSSKISPDTPLQKENYAENSIVTEFLNNFDDLSPVNYENIRKIVENTPSRFKEWSLKRKDEIIKLTNMEPADIERRLFDFWAQDLADYLKSTPASIVFFLDSYEALWEQRRSKEKFSLQDKWIRNIISVLPHSCLWVICGREPLQWEEIDRKFGDCLEQYQLEKLPEKDAINLMSLYGIEEEDIQKAIIESSKCLPLYLELSIDSYKKIVKKRQPEPNDFYNVPSEVYNRLIKYLSDQVVTTLKILSSLHFWNQDIYEALTIEIGYSLIKFSELSRFSFIQEDQGKLYIQPLMRECLQIYQDQNLKKKIHRFMLGYYENQLKNIDIKKITPFFEESLREAFYHAKETLETEELFKWFIKYLYPLYKAAFWQLIIPMYIEMLKIFDTRMGSENTYVSTLLNHLATLYNQIGEYEKALPLCQRVLKIHEKLLEKDNMQVAQALNNLAEYYRAKGEYESALKYYNQALEIIRNVVGEEHPENSTVLNSLTELYYQMGEYEKALPLCQRVLKIHEKLLEKDNMQVAQALNNLAEYYRAKGEYERALKYYNQALEIIRNVMGEEHPENATILNNLALLYENIGEYEKALPFYQNSLEIREKLLGPNHPSVAITVNNLATLYYQMGDYKKALPLFQRALSIRENVLGPNHPDIPQTLNNLAVLYEGLRDYEKALPLYVRALEIHIKVHGLKHPDVASTLHNLAGLFESMGDYEKAFPLYQQALDIREKILGSQSLEFAVTLNNLAGVYCRVGNYDEALPRYEKVLEIYERIMGPKHPDVATILNSLSGLYESMGNYEKVLPIYLRILCIRERVLGLQHPDVASTLHNLAGYYSQIGMYKEALTLYNRALRIYENVFGENHLVATTLINMAKIYSILGMKEKSKEICVTDKKIPHIKEILLEKYREKPVRRDFEFGKMNLIFGPNGRGKTSLLEAIEMFLCGNNYRDPKNTIEYRIKVSFGEGTEFEEMNIENKTKYKIRNSYWYNDPYDADTENSNIVMNFNRYNFYNTDAAVRFSNENSLGEIKKAFEDISLGENVNYIEKRLKDSKLKLSEKIRDCDSLIDEYNKRINLAKKVRDNLSANTNIEYLFKKFLDEASKIKWIRKLPAKMDDSYTDFENDYSRAKIYLSKIFEIIYWTSNLTFDSLKNEKNKLDLITESIRLIDANINEAKKRIEIRIEEKSETLNISIYEEEKRMEDLYKKRENIINYFFDHFKPMTTPNVSKQDNFEAFIQIKSKGLEYSMELFEKLSLIITISSTDSLKELEQSLLYLYTLFESFRTEVNKKIDVNKASEVIESEIKDCEKKLEDMNKKKKIICQGYTTIKNILLSYSKEEYLHNFMEKNKYEILRIFSAIHSPKEFENIKFSFNSNIVLKRSKSSEYIEISKISTGQRSALALSVFLSLNNNLKNGPPYIIFDDPISFIDDLNILSFIDYLREIVLKTNRQIFFATANENLAFLISKKFEFLGDSEFKVHMLK